MFQKLITYSIRHKLVVGVFTIALIIWGIVSLIHLPFDSTPDITDNQVQVITQAPSLGAQEVEQYVTTPVEMALANIPELKERRSISRSGLSVITLVFDDDVDIYWARSQVSQMLNQVEKDLPKNTETEMGPIATGLGEIYHYTVRAEKGYEHKYSLTQLRTIQDWIVRKQLSGTPGVAEVSGWGGYVKQYEVAINTDKLNACNLTVSEVFDALEKNNANTGGSYIEENSNQYFIRGIGVVKRLEDVANIAVKTVNGTPVKIGDVAKVQLGHATRFGAVTRNGEGEVVAGIAIMLKGENFQEVIRNVKLRIEQIQKSLPEGVVIEPFIDRTNLVDRVEGTIARNLIEGGLIVIFVLVIFLGNWRAGLVVASVIPLSMLFAFGMMKTFGIDGNLMSLGAIDFGMIVDSAVIIVEAVVAHLGVKSIERRARISSDTPIRFSQAEMDEEVHDSASRIRKSAAFGEIIIMIVYIPLMTLVGIEGKMFRPMALTVFFAILGAFILSLTYVPMASALFLSKKGHVRKTFSDRMIEKLQGWYRPVLEWVLARYKDVITGAVSLLCMSAVAFHFLGGEFIPSLEEGDFAVEMTMSQGTSLSQMVESCSKAEKLLKAEYPEIRQVVSRIGSAEIPTDPMPMERADIMVALKPKAEWTSAETTAELMEKMEETLKTIPGLKAEISQPILGGEFIPSLEEGDFAVEMTMSQGTSLSQMVESCSKAEKLLKAEYPEIRQVVSRIGSAEIPTDPMPMERADIMVALKPKAEWTSAETTAELMEKMEETLKTIPGLKAEISQPIQMRNNELLTGIKQDVAIKIFGDNLDVLTQQADKVSRMIRNVPGVSGIFVEEVSGLPQIQVKYNHERMAAYGITVDEINRILETTFAGATTGAVYEGDKKFDIVLRLDPKERNLQSLQSLRIPLAGGESIPLSQLADVVYEPAPAQVSHENGARRIYVGFNVKGRDVQSTVKDIQTILDEKLKLPEGYYYNYGGEFENLQSATQRLLIVVPIALIIILLLLYATVKNLRESLFVFSAIPLAAIGGVWALWLRGMPFSISAGVGFIALFGVAVLNGIVLIGQMHQMQKQAAVVPEENGTSLAAVIQKRIIDSCMIRLRPVLMTALVASMGFLPMALSHGDGAEVQRPLATVVIGGLITSTLLTLLVLPAIYKMFTKK